MSIFYLPRQWSWSLGFTESRSHFAGTAAEWRPSGTTRLTFPIANQGQRRLSGNVRSEEHTSELQSPCNLVCRLLLEKKKKKKHKTINIEKTPARRESHCRAV